MANNQSVRRHLDAFTRGRIIEKLEGRPQCDKPEETGGRQREKSLDTRHGRLDDRYRVFRGQKTARWWSVCTTPCTVCTFNACPSERGVLCVVPGTPELERQ
ncbi:hypothetical protein TNCV_2657611 [Trichonephila clavipes]|nr:hypothetical protein TNCV_2657611 [Trichonephila clavipes]